MKSFILLSIFATILTSCATSSARKDLAMKRASFDLDCSKEKLTAIDIDNSTFGVKGCGKKAVYIVDCRDKMNIGACRAILNSDTSKRLKNQ